MKVGEAVLPFAATAALLAIDVDYVNTLWTSGILAGASMIELVLFAAGPAKTAVMFAVGRLRRGSAAVALDVYGADLLLLPFLALAYALFGYSFLPGIMKQLILGWVIGASVGGLAFMAFRTGRSMLLSEGLAKIIPGAIVNSEAGLLFISSAGAAGAKGGSLDAVIRAAVSGYGVISPADPIFLDFAVMYVVLLLYAALRGGRLRAAIEPKHALMALAATGVTGAWALATRLVPVVPPAIVFVTPALAIVAVSWVLGHGS